MDASLQRKLRRLGAVKGVQNLKPASMQQPVEMLAAPSTTSKAPLPGGEINTPRGNAWIWRRHYPAATYHGHYRLGELANLDRQALALLGGANLGTRIAFLDTETTGLAGGAGTLVFLTGVGVWESDGITLHLVFLRDPDEEPAALDYLANLLQGCTGLVTFNGAGFDLPLLESRFILQRMVPGWGTLPHLDLLTVARLLWREHLPSRRLGMLETELLGINRTETDLPSWLIPSAYREYLLTGRTDEIRRIFYHNEVDVLSMVTLLVHCAQRMQAPETFALAAGEWVGIGRLYERAGQIQEAETAWQRALEEDTLPTDVATRLWQTLAHRRKQNGEWEAALEIWECWANRLPRAIEPLIERAKVFEWLRRDPVAALRETERALERAGTLTRGIAREEILGELRHREARLRRKLSTQGC
ncbi:MAG: ribonuclease H-like domain-containing protein [Anaerolineae bacterium]|nr:ribonuclease H-like domain-containing protein [Anaerolineae bacterium]